MTPRSDSVVSSHLTCADTIEMVVDRVARGYWQQPLRWTQLLEDLGAADSMARAPTADLRQFGISRAEALADYDRARLALLIELETGLQAELGQDTER